MNSLPPAKKIKTEAESDATGENGDAETERKEQEQEEVERNKWRLSHYTAELGLSERKLEETKNQLARLQGQHNILASRETAELNVKVERRSASPTHVIPDSCHNQSQILESQLDSVKSLNKSEVDVKRVKGSSGSTLLLNGEGSSQNKIQSRPQIVIPAVNTVTTQLTKSHLGAKSSNGTVKPSGVKSRKISSELEIVDKQSKGTKRKFGGSSSARTVHCETGNIIPCQHKRKLKVLFCVRQMIIYL